MEGLRSSKSRGDGSSPSRGSTISLEGTFGSPQQPLQHAAKCLRSSTGRAPACEAGTCGGSSPPGDASTKKGTSSQKQARVAQPVELVISIYGVKVQVLPRADVSLDASLRSASYRGYTKFVDARVAQPVEQVVANHKVEGSSPSAGATSSILFARVAQRKRTCFRNTGLKVRILPRVPTLFTSI